MSRAAAYRNLKREDMKNFLRAREVTLIGGTLDESPEVYKDINKVIAGQTDLVDVLAKFEPKVVRMAEEKAQWTQRRNKKKAINFYAARAFCPRRFFIFYARRYCHFCGVPPTYRQKLPSFSGAVSL